jgi:hypothetical protein
MKRTTAGLCVAAAFALAASLNAQTTSSATQSSGDEVSVTGCLEKSPSGGFVLNNAKMDTDSSNTGASGTTGTAGSTAAGSASSAYGSMTGGSTWMLEGESSDLEKHVGHKIQVTGKQSEHSSSSTAGTSGTTASSTPSKHLDVKSVKMVSATCP